MDRYTKTLLTIIAAALVGLLAVQLTPSAHAQIGEGCGNNKFQPCYIEITR